MRFLEGVRTTFGALLMFLVMLLFAGIALRLALHAREVNIPDFSGLTVAEASDAALHRGLDLNIADKYYSRTVPAGRILSQAPAAGSRVRRGWQVRVTESLGPQQVTIPDVVGEPVREASLDLRRASLDLGTLAHMDAPGDPDMVLAQTPPPDAGVDQPRVNLLLSQQGGGESSSFVLPSFVGMSYAVANHAAIQLGLRVALLGDLEPQTQPAQPAPSPPAQPATAPPATPSNSAATTKNQTAAPAPAIVMVPVGPVTAQSPPAGYRAGKNSVIRLIFGHPAGPSQPPATPTTPPQSH